MDNFKNRSYSITKDIIEYLSIYKNSLNAPIKLKNSIMKISTDKPTSNNEMIVSAFSIASKYNTIMCDIDDGRLFFYVINNDPDPSLVLNVLDGMNIRLWGIPTNDLSFIKDNKMLVEIVEKILDFINYLNE